MEFQSDRLLATYILFYQERLEEGLAVDRKASSPYADQKTLNDSAKMKRSLLANPFEKFERKRFMYHCKDLNRISFSPVLWNQLMEKIDVEKVKAFFFKELLAYYEDYDGVPNQGDLAERFDVVGEY